MSAAQLNPENGYIFRIVHRDNVPWILHHGLHCKNSRKIDPHYVNIGNVDLIDHRSRKRVPISPFGTLSDYIPFYFTPYTPMLLNIKTGYNGVTQRKPQEIVILTSSIHRLREGGVRFLFTDRHAYLNTANFYADPVHLDQVDWGILQKRDFKRDNDDLGKVERYQAEALVHREMPIEGLLGILCYDESSATSLNEAIAARNISLQAAAKPGWYI